MGGGLAGKGELKEARLKVACDHAVLVIKKKKTRRVSRKDRRLKKAT